MATSEPDIRKAVAVLLHQYGELDTTEIKKLLPTVMIFDEDDNEISQTRSEPRIMQRIGNIVSHQREIKKQYYDTYEIDKSSKPARWFLLRGLKTKGELKSITEKEIRERRELRAQFIPKKIDWQGVHGRRNELGRRGEEYVIRYETKRILKFSEKDTERLIHLSEAQGDGAGFDIISIDEDGNERYIEVKTTRGNLDTPFYMTENERAYFELYKNATNLFIYRVYNFDDTKEIPSGLIKEISASELLENYTFNPISYKVTKKGS